MRKLFPNIRFLAILVTSIGITTLGCQKKIDYFEPYDPMPEAHTIINPYAGVNFSTALRLKSNLHTHTTASDGNQSAVRMIRAYAELGYDVVAITDHEKHYAGNTEKITIEGREILVIRGSEITMTHHFNSLFTDFGRSSFAFTVEEAMQSEMDNAKSLLFLNHPGRHIWFYPISWYADMYRKFPKEHLLGQEVVNAADTYPTDRETWDKVLTAVSPFRTVYGYANDDSHALDETGFSYNEFLVSDFTEEEVRNAIANGISFFFSKSTIPNAMGEMPHVKSIVVDPTLLTIEVDAEKYHKIEWFSCCKIVSTSPKISINSSDERRYHLGKYVRFVLTGEGGQLFSQPFLIQ